MLDPEPRSFLSLEKSPFAKKGGFRGKYSVERFHRPNDSPMDRKSGTRTRFANNNRNFAMKRKRRQCKPNREPGVPVSAARRFASGARVQGASSVPVTSSPEIQAKIRRHGRANRGKLPFADGSKDGAMTSARGAVDLAKRQGYEKHGTIGPVALHWIDFLSRKTAMLEAESRGTVRGRFGCLEWNRLTFRAANLPREPAS